MDAFRAAYLRTLAPDGSFGATSYGDEVEATLDALADHLDSHLDTPRILAIARAGP